MAAENEPAPGPAPRLFLAGCSDGLLLRLRHDVDVAAANEIEQLVAGEPPWTDPQAEPRIVPRLRQLLGGGEPQFGLTFELPHGLVPATEAAFVRSGTLEGGRLLDRLAAEGPPAALASAGFGAPEEFWPPWCAALVGGEIAAVAFAARLGPRGAALGLATLPDHRGRGLGAAVAAAWTGHPDLGGRVLFYGCARENRSSRRVVQRLGLRFVGPTLRLA